MGFIVRSNRLHCYVFLLIQYKSSLLSSLPPPEHVTSLTSLVPQSLSKAAAAAKSKTSVPQKPVVEPTRTVKPASSVGFVSSRLLASSATAVGGSIIEDSDEEGGSSNADFFSLDAADEPPMYPATFNSSETVDVRWGGLSSRLAPAATFVPSDSNNISAASADIVWNATNYSSAVTELPPVCDVTMVCKCLLSANISQIFIV